MKFDSLLNRKINFEHNGVVINSFKLLSIKYTPRQMKGRGRLYLCMVEWENKDLIGADPKLCFDFKTLEDLYNDKLAISPIGETMLYEMID